MKQTLTIIACLLSIVIYGQEVKATFDGHKWEAPYHLPIPRGWTIERFLLPTAFAPSIEYKGVEDIRFAPGWANAKSEDYWSYTFLWYLEGKVKLNTKLLTQHVIDYYTGLAKVNTDSSNAAKLVPATASLQQVTSTGNDLKTWCGTVQMVDFVQQKEMTVHCKVHLQRCEALNKTIVFFEISPQPYTHKVWTSLGELWKEFRCTAK